MKTVAIGPMYNEGEKTFSVIQRFPRDVVQEVVIVNDASTDGTRERLKEIESQNGMKVLYHSKNQGKGAALRTGFQAATGDFVIIQDTDLEYDPNEYGRILEPLIVGKAEVVYGSRFVGGESHRVLYFWHSIANKFLTLLCNMVTNLNLTDMEVGYKAFRRDILRQMELKEDRFGFEPEFTIKMSRLKKRVYEVGISYAGRTYGEGKKIGWKDGIRALIVILKYGLLEL